MSSAFTESHEEGADSEPTSDRSSEPNSGETNPGSSKDDETSEAPVDELSDTSQIEPDVVDKDAATLELEPAPPPPVEAPGHILTTACAVMGVFAATRPDDYVARLEASPSEQMTITDDSLSNELERELLTSAAAMCLWQEWMIWYPGERTNAFADAFGKMSPVFARGRAGQWTIVPRLRAMKRRLRS